MAVRSQLVRALEDADVVRVKQIMECEANKAGLGDEVMTKEFLQYLQQYLQYLQEYVPR